MAHQCGISGRQVRSDGGSEAVGAMLRGEPGAGAEGEWEAEVEAEVGGVPLTVYAKQNSSILDSLLIWQKRLIPVLLSQCCGAI